MQKPLFAAFTCLLAGSFLLSACGGDSASGNEDPGGGTNPAGTAAMAAAFATEMTSIKACLQSEVDAKTPCAVNFLQDPITRYCSDVRTGRPNQFAGADYTKFTATCDSWATVLQSDAAGKITKLDTMIADVNARK